MKINQLRKILNSFGDSVYFEHDLKKKNWFNIGGKTKVFYKAYDLKELIKFLSSEVKSAILFEFLLRFL